LTKPIGGYRKLENAACLIDDPASAKDPVRYAPVILERRRQRGADIAFSQAGVIETVSERALAIKERDGGAGSHNAAGTTENKILRLAL